MVPRFSRARNQKLEYRFLPGRQAKLSIRLQTNSQDSVLGEILSPSEQGLDRATIPFENSFARASVVREFFRRLEDRKEEAGVIHAPGA
jgi:hypothetical protein